MRAPLKLVPQMREMFHKVDPPRRCYGSVQVQCSVTRVHLIDSQVLGRTKEITRPPRRW